MVYLEFLEEVDGVVYYEYMPERRDAERGVVAIDRGTRERTLVKLSPASDMSMYYAHAWSRIDQMLDDGELKLQAYAAWY